MSASPAPGMPSEETLARALDPDSWDLYDKAAAIGPRNQFIMRTARSSVAKSLAHAATVSALIRPAFEALEREIDRLQEAAEYWPETSASWEQRALSAEAKLREANMQALSDDGQMRELQAKLAQAVEAEREACAKVAEDFPAHEHGHLDADPHYAAQQAVHEVAAAIRARAAAAMGEPPDSLDEMDPAGRIAAALVTCNPN